MKKFTINTLCLLFGLSIPMASALSATPNVIFQVATISSLAQGVYDGDYDYGRLMKQGDFGLGTFLNLDGEMVAIDGKFYQMESTGKLNLVTNDQITPFAEVTYFKPTLYENLGSLATYKILGNALLNFFPNKNISYAIRIDGEFKSLKLRSFRKQTKPYPPLTKASEEEAIFNLQNVKGSLVGFWFPKYWSGIAVPEFHFHFITQDHRIGGHVLEVNLTRGQVSLAPIQQIQVYLPNTKSFAQADLSTPQLTSSIKKAEGGT